MNNILELNGTSTYVEVPLASPTNDGGAITVEFWNYVAKGQKAFAFLFTDGKGVNQSKWVGCQAPWDDGQIYWNFGNRDIRGRLVAKYNQEYFNKWTHIALVSGGKEGLGYQAIYINGQILIEQKQFLISPDRPFTTLLIGAGEEFQKEGEAAPSAYAKNWYYEGRIDEFRVWNRVRSQEEIQRDMMVELRGDEPGLVTYLTFNWAAPYTPENLTWLTKDQPDIWKGMPNRVPNSTKANLYNFSESNWVPSGVEIKGASVGPVYRLTSQDGKNQSYTTKFSKKKQGDEAVFYAHLAATPGTTPLYSFFNKTQQQRITVDPLKWDELDGRIDYEKPTGDWVFDDEIAYVSLFQNGNAIPLYEYKTATGEYRYTTEKKDLLDKTTDQKVACYVLPKPDSVYKPREISFMDNGLSEHLWYVLLCRSYEAYKKGWGLGIDEKDGDKPKLMEIPKTGEYERFQWRLLGNRLINRATGLVLLISNGQVTRDLRDDKSQAQQWSFTLVPNKGTDCFSLVQGGNALSYKSGSLSIINSGQIGESEQWTLLAIEPIHGYTLPAPPKGLLALPYSKYLPAAASVNVLGTGTVSDWAMLRVKLIVDNMVGALKKGINTDNLGGVEVVVISKHDSNNEVSAYPSIGFLMREDPNKIQEIRGGAFHLNKASLCYVTEEMMWKKGVFNRPGDEDFRMFDQVVHEFAHIMDDRLGFNSSNFPQGGLTTGPSEVIAGKIQSWFNSIGTVNTKSHYNPATRSELKENFKAQYEHLEKYFDPANTWMPPVEFRDNPSITQPYDVLLALGNYTFEKDKEFYCQNGQYFVRFQSDGNFVVYDGTLKPIWTAPVAKTWNQGKKAVFTSGGNLVIYGATDNVLWETNTAGNPSAQLQLDDNGKLSIQQGTTTKTLWSSN